MEVYIEVGNRENELGCGSNENGSESADGGSWWDDVDDEDFYDCGYEFEEDDMIFDSHADHDAEIEDHRTAIDHEEIQNAILSMMQWRRRCWFIEGYVDCVDIDELFSDVASDDVGCEA